MPFIVRPFLTEIQKESHTTSLSPDLSEEHIVYWNLR